MEFNQAFQDKVLRLLLSPKPEEAKTELLQMHGEILAFYKEKGWTEYPGQLDSSSSELSSSVNAESAVERVKRIEKPVAPVKKDAAFSSVGLAVSSSRPSVIQTLNIKSGNGTPSPRPSPSGSPRVPMDLMPVEEPAGLKRKGSANADVGLFERFEDRNLEESDEEGSPKKKLRRVVIADSSSENDDDKRQISKAAPVSSGMSVETETNRHRPESDILTKIQEKEKKSNHSPSPSWGDSLCFICRSSSQDEHNAVIQCIDCSKNYHQSCHDPKIRTAEKNDPRFIFRCSSCVKKRDNRLGSAGGNNPAKIESAHPSRNSRETTKDSTRKQRESEELASFKKAAEKRRADTAASTNVVTSVQPPVKAPTPASVASKAADFLAKHKGLSNKPNPKSPLGQGASGISQKPTQGLGLSKWAQQPPTTQGQGLIGLGKLAAGSQKTSASALSSQPDFAKALASQSTTMMAQADRRLQAMKKKAAQAKFSRNFD